MTNKIVIIDLNQVLAVSMLFIPIAVGQYCQNKELVLCEVFNKTDQAEAPQFPNLPYSEP
jgi:hypothetical protein